MAAPADIVTQYLASLAGGDPETIAGFVAQDFHNEHLSALGVGSDGREEYLRRLPGFLSSFADRSYAVDHIVEQRRTSTPDAPCDVVVRYRLAAAYEGHPIEIPGVMWFEVRGGLVDSRVDVWDSLTFMQQTGQTDRP